MFNTSVRRASVPRAWTLRLLLAALAITFVMEAARAQHLEFPIAIGSTTRLWSQALGEQRQLLVYLPPYYDVSGKAYPVLYLLDAEDHFLHAVGIVQFLASYNERIPEMIVVGVSNSRLSAHRDLDLTPPLQDAEEKRKMSGGVHGGSARFLKFMADELAPWIDARYRTVPYRILMGHSLGGLFSTYAMVTRPEVFQAHIAVSPSLWWDKQAAVERTEAGIRALPDPPALFLSWGDNEPTIAAPARRLAANLTARPVPGLLLEHRHYAGDDHLSTPHRSLYDALERLFAAWRMPLQKDGKWLEVSADQIDAHYSKLARRFGYAVKAPPGAYRAAALTFEERTDKTAALAVLRRGVVEYPYRADMHMLLGWALEKLDRKEEALLCYRNAVHAAVTGQRIEGSEIEDYCSDLRRLGDRALPASCTAR